MFKGHFCKVFKIIIKVVFNYKYKFIDKNTFTQKSKNQ